MSRSNNYTQNFYTVINKEKYAGRSQPFYRSSYELRFFKWLDFNVNVLEWSSESVCIPYLFEVDNSKHNYFPDAKAKIKSKDGTIKTYLIEVKPFKQQFLPEKPKRNSIKRMNRYKNELFMYTRNKNKWDAAKEYCKLLGYEFIIITEKHIFNDKR
jgi:hypothetical protein